MPLRSADCAACAACNPDALLINEWFNYTPELQPIVVALSSPLPLLLCLCQLTKVQAQALQQAVGHICIDMRRKEQAREWQPHVASRR